MKKKRKLVILGDSAFAEVAYEYFTHDSEYEVVAFSVEKEFLKRQTLFGLPVVPFEQMENNFAPEEHFFFAALAYTTLNRLRKRLYQAAKNKGYVPASYVSSRAFVWPNVQIGEHCFIFENNVVQPFVKLGNNIILWSGNHIGHHSSLGDHCFIASHVVISGFVSIEKNCFIGVNATVNNNVIIGKDCVIGAGALVIKDLVEDTVVQGLVGEPRGNARRLNRVKDTL
jgi:sugar O-acyltransferase (sialic acid O-acetyltransferase NeuD family)